MSYPTDFDKKNIKPLEFYYGDDELKLKKDSINDGDDEDGEGGSSWQEQEDIQALLDSGKQLSFEQQALLEKYIRVNNIKVVDAKAPPPKQTKSESGAQIPAHPLLAEKQAFSGVHQPESTVVSYGNDEIKDELIQSRPELQPAPAPGMANQNQAAPSAPIPTLRR